MSLQEYAEEMNFTVQDVLNKCKELGIKVNSKDEYLDDEAIIMLDNCMNLINNDAELSFEETDAIDDVVEDIMDMINSNLLKLLTLFLKKKLRRIKINNHLIKII